MVFESARHLELFGSGFDEAETAIDGEQLGAEAEDGNVHGLAPFSAEVIFGGGKQAFAQPRALVRGIDREHAEVAASATNFCIDAGEDLAGGVFGEENFAFLHHGGEAFFVGASAFEEGFDGEGGVNDGDETRAVGGGGEADVQVDGNSGHGRSPG